MKSSDWYCSGFIVGTCFTLGLTMGTLLDNPVAQKLGWGICGAVSMPHLFLVNKVGEDDEKN